ncbi:MAG: hypothetical protein Q4D57_00060 [Clostridia bacterium]|nr:hypothetical protein [Clostridia bacterium]
MYKYERISRSNNLICVRSFFGKTENNDNFFKKILRKNRKKHNINAVKFLLICLILMASIVAISIALSVAEKGDNALGLSDYDNFIWPVVMQNPESFNENSPAEVDTMVSAAVWKASAEKKDDKSKTNDEGQLVLSFDEVREACESLFDRTFDKKDLTDVNEDYFKFDENKNCFFVESVSGVDNYIPHTVNAYRKDDDIILKVGYVLPSDSFEPDMSGILENNISKYKIYHLKTDKTTGKKYVSAVE